MRTTSINRRFTSVALAALIAMPMAALGGAFPADSARASTAPTLAATSAQAVPLTAEDADAWLDGLVPGLLAREGIVGASIVVVDDGEIITQRGFGSAEVDEHGAQVRPVDPASTLFRLGSVSKLMVGTAVMQLVEQGLLDLDAPVQDHLDFELNTSFDTPITLRHLLTHTAGFEDRYMDVLLPQGSPSPTLRDAVKDSPAQIFEPGTTPAYSNYSSALAAYIVERVSGEPFEQYAKAHVFDPAGMTTATFEQPVPDALQDAVTTTYASAGAPPFHFQTVGPWPAGGMSASAHDMGQFLIAHLETGSSPLLSEASLATMHSPALSERELGGLATGDTMAISFYEKTRHGITGLAHGGDLSHDHAELWMSPEHRTGIYVAFNSSGVTPTSPVAFRELIVEGFVERYLADGYETPQALESSAENAAALAGSYQLSRRVESSFVRAYDSLSTIAVVPDGTGGAVIPFLTDSAGVPLRFVEVEPGLWQSDRSSDQFSVRYDEAGNVAAIGMHPAFVLSPLPPAKAFVLPALIFAVIVFLVTVLAWPIGAIARATLRAPSETPKPDRRIHLVTRLAAIAALVGLALWFVVAGQIMGFSGTSQVLIRVAQVFTLVGVLAILPATWRAVREFRQRNWWRAVFAVIVALGFAGWAYTAIAGGLLLPNINT